MLNSSVQKEKAIDFLWSILCSSHRQSQLKAFSLYFISRNPHPKGNISATFLNDDKYTKARYSKNGIILSKLIPPQTHLLEVFCQRWVAKAELNYVTEAREGKEKIMCERFDPISNRLFPFWHSWVSCSEISFKDMHACEREKAYTYATSITYSKTIKFFWLWIIEILWILPS